MVRRVRLGGVALIVALAGLAAACSIASPTYVTSKEITAKPDGSAEGGGDPSGESAGDPSGGTAQTCSTSDFVAPDVSTLTACGNGRGHCFDKTKSPMADQLTACPDASQVCVPDEILAAAGKPLQSCNSIIGPGACITSSLVPEIERQGGSALKQDACSAGQLCVPCTDPTHNNAPTPFCQPIGVHSSACAAGGGGTAADAGEAPMQACCQTGPITNGVCISESAIPPEALSSTIREVCSAGTRCAPKALVTLRPVMCDADILGRGVCIDKCFSGYLALAGSIGLLDQSNCGPTEVCLPCGVVGSGVPGCG